MAAGSEQNIPTPNEQDLAFFVPAGGLHGYNIAFPGHIQYWRKQYRRAGERVEPGREILAGQVLSWLTLDGGNPNARDPALSIGTGPPDEKITPGIAEGYRRYMLGGLAVSRLLRSGSSFDINEEIRDGLASGGMDAVTDMAINHDHPDEWPFEPRFHIAFGPKLTGELVVGDVWSMPSPNLLVCRRYPADVTPTTVAYMQSKGAYLDPERAVTILPHLIAEHAPQFPKK